MGRINKTEQIKNKVEELLVAVVQEYNKSINMKITDFLPTLLLLLYN